MCIDASWSMLAASAADFKRETIFQECAGKLGLSAALISDDTTDPENPKKKGPPKDVNKGGLTMLPQSTTTTTLLAAAVDDDANGDAGATIHC